MMAIEKNTERFFITGGTLQADAPSYVERPADVTLLNHLLEGEYCYVLTTRQMGKSSLMARTKSRLETQGVRVAYLELTGIGSSKSSKEEETWYRDIIADIADQLELATDPKLWWNARDEHGPVSKFIRFMREVVLEECPELVVIAVDELDFLLHLPFSDDFLGAIRTLYNLRATQLAARRLCFVLIGVVSPTDLIRDRHRTPFNVGQAVEVRALARVDAAKLEAGWPALPPASRVTVLDRVFYWTNGQPYLTQQLCAEIARRDDLAWTADLVDASVTKLFLDENAGDDRNLQFVRERVTQYRKPRALLLLYRRVLRGEDIADDPRSPLQNELKLAGLVMTEHDKLCVANRLYRQVFDETWIAEQLPPPESRRWALALAAVVMIALVMVGYLIYRQKNLSNEVRAELYRDNFASAVSPAVRLSNLAGLMNLPGYGGEAQDLFFALSHEQQVVLFEGLNNPQELEAEILTVVAGVYQDARWVGDRPAHSQVLQVIMDTLLALADARAGWQAQEIEYWLVGRQQVEEGNNDRALIFYEQALSKNSANALLLFERGMIYAAQAQYEAALNDWEEVLALDASYVDEIQTLVKQLPALYAYWGANYRAYPAVAEGLSIPTSTPAPTHAPTFTPQPTLTPTPTPTPTPRIRSIDGMKMVFLRGGEFQMGTSVKELAVVAQCVTEGFERDVCESWVADEQPAHQVVLSDFWMDMTEVSNQQFVAYLNGLGDAVQIRNGDLVVYDGKVIYDLSCYNCKNWWEERIVWNGVQFSVVAGYEEHPVAMVSWHGADGYCTNVGGRLPTEAQWEYAARGATGNLYPWGNDFGCARGNFDDETAFDDFVIPGGMGCDGYDTTAPVGSFPVGASWAGVLDLSGNVWEWTADWYSDYSAARQDNPTGQVTGDLKVLRGGGWSNSVMLSLRGAYRYREDPFVRTAGFGFRCVVVPGD